MLPQREISGEVVGALAHVGALRRDVRLPLDEMPVCFLNNLRAQLAHLIK